KRDPIILTDGGVYDNLGVEPVWDRCNTILISDAGHPFASLPNVRQWAVPRLQRAAEISAEQVGAVRKRWFVEQLMQKQRGGAIWEINSVPSTFSVSYAQQYDTIVLQRLADIRTDLNRFSEGETRCLENHGYWLADAGVRSYAAALSPNPAAPFAYPDMAW